jgi:anti-anti-sigma factor
VCRRVDGATGVVELTIVGELDAATAGTLDAAFDDVVGGGVHRVVVNLVAVTFLDSTGLRSLVRAANQLEEAGGTLWCAPLSPQVRRVLELSGLGERLTGAGLTRAEPAASAAPASGRAAAVDRHH